MDKEKKHYWLSLAERSGQANQWQKPEFQTSRNEMAAEAADSRLSRANFLKFMGAGAVMTTAACRKPVERIVPAVIQPPEMTPGVPLFYSTTAPDGTGLTVRTREGRPVKLAGNAGFPGTNGGASASTIASLLDLYDPDRLRRPVLLEKGKKKKAAPAEVVAAARNLIKKGNYLLWTNPLQGPSSRALVTEFLQANPGGKHVEWSADATWRQVAQGQELSYGQRLLPDYRFDRANLVVSFDADFLGTHIQPARFTHAFAQARNIRRAKEMNRLIVIESMFSVTGGNADERFAVRPGDALITALSIAAELDENHGLTAGKDLSAFLPARVADYLGIPADALKKIAGELSRERGRSLVLAGGVQSGPELQVAVNLLNSMLGNDGITVDYQNSLFLSAGMNDRELKNLLSEIKRGAYGAIILSGVNPLYHVPGLKAEDLGGTPIVQLTDRLDETSVAAAMALPLNHYLENWGDLEFQKEIYGIVQPVIRPLYETRSFEDYLIAFSGGSLGGATRFYDFLRGRWAARGEAFWTSFLQTGFYAPGQSRRNGTAANRKAGALDTLPATLPAAGGMRLGPYYSLSMLDGSGANNAYRQELPDPITKTVWGNHVCVLPETARKQGWKQGEILEIKTGHGSLRLPVLLQPGLHPESLTVALGYGREAAGKTGNRVGANGLALGALEATGLQLSGLSVSTEKTGDRVEIPCTQTVYRDGYNKEDKAFFAPDSVPNAPYGGSSQYDRPIILEANLDEFKKNPGQFKPEKIHYPKDASLMPAWQYTGMRWHMVIDLTSCTGCNACVTSCHTENNVPMVGPDEVLMGREMHWLRIDRYYSGDEKNPDVAYQPMLCQHCENAPCETVCPVAATTHDSEGLNQMTYNRCIGTRYCANNCPYKVRRFNFFENWIYMDGLVRKLRSPQQLALNPDVTVRSRGVMEKCSFCVQRIATARQEAKARGSESVRDGDMVTACQEVCPTGAISFGNINDEKSRVNRLSRDERAYKVLDFLKVEPSVTYLAKIRNKA
ncbi:MAG: 4Fe-4S dicluster domain-containing protein [Spirochaetales bacterium]|nr:4Fe-4S dicluster domain-containing protein [Spirochaetales bacterium]